MIDPHSAHESDSGADFGDVALLAQNGTTFSGTLAVGVTFDGEEVSTVVWAGDANADVGEFVDNNVTRAETFGRDVTTGLGGVVLV